MRRHLYCLLESAVVFFEIRGDITEVETFAVGKSIRELPRLRKLYGKGRWRKRKGIATVKLPNGTIREVRASLVRSIRNWQEGIEDQTLHGLNMPARRPKSMQYAVCVRNAGFEAALEVRKLYAVLDDSDAEANNLIRVIDESGEDYVYPVRMFQRLNLPAEVQRALRLAS